MAWRKPKDLGEWLAIFKRNKKKFFFTAVLVMIGVAYASQWVPRSYVAEAKFQRRNEAALQQTDQKGDSISLRQVDRLRRMINEDIRGRTAVETLVEDLGLTKGMPRVNGELTIDGQMAKHDLVAKMSGKIGVNFQVRDDQVDLVAVSYSDADRELAPKVANRIVENYIRDTRMQLNEVLRQTQEFFDKEAARYMSKVRELESSKLRFEMDNRGLLPDDPQSAQTKLVELQSRLGQVTQALGIEMQKRDALILWAKEQPDVHEEAKYGDNPLLLSLNDQRKNYQDALDGQKSFGRRDNHPDVVKIKKRIEEVEAKIEKTAKVVVVETMVRPNIEKLQAQRESEIVSSTIKAMEKDRDETQGQIEHYEVLNRNFFVVRNDYMKIQREMEEAEQQLKFWEENQRRAKIALTAEIGQRGVRLSMIQRAPDLARPSFPQPIQVAGAALVLGLGVGALMILLSELVDNSFHSVNQAVDELKLPILGAVNEIVSARTVLRRKILGWGVFPALGTVMVLVLGGVFALTYLSLEQPHHYEKLMNRPTAFISDALFGN